MPEVLATRLVREHGEELIRLEVEELRQLRKILEQARKELLGQLSDVRADTFTAQRLRSVKVQIDSAIRATVKKFNDRSEDRLLGLTNTAIDQTLAEIGFWEPKFRGGATRRIRIAAARRLLPENALLLNQHKVSIDAYGLNLIRETQGRLSVHLVKNSPWSEMSQDIAGRLHKNAIAGATWKAERIVRTEMVGVLNAGHQAALVEAADVIPGLMRQWDAHMDTRTSDICRRLNGRVREMDKSFGSYRGRPIMKPPSLPNCRSRLVAFHPDWAEMFGEGDLFEKPIESRRTPKPPAPKVRPKPKKKAPKATKKKPTAKAKRASLKQAVHREENAIRLQPVEHGVLFDQDGSVLLKKSDGLADGIRFTSGELKGFPGKVFTHNHPGGASLSGQDVKLAMHHDLAEIRAAGKRHTYSMKPKRGKPWSADFWANEVEPVYLKSYEDVLREFKGNIESGSMTAKGATILHDHEVWKRVSKKVGMVYSRVQVP